MIGLIIKKNKKKIKKIYLTRHTARERLERKEKLLGLRRSRVCILSYRHH